MSHRFRLPIHVGTLMRLLILLVGSLMTSAALGQTYSTLYTFKGSTDGDFPFGPLLIDASGNLYGTAMFGGIGRDGRPTANGTVFELSSTSGTWTETTLYSFKGGPDGSTPSTGVISDTAGNLYGTSGPAPGMIFELVPPNVAGQPWTHNVFYRFHGSDGSGPNGLIPDSAGGFYGSTVAGGLCNAGAVFHISPPTIQGGAWTERVLFSLDEPDCKSSVNGFWANQVLLGQDGALYFSTIGGGQYDLGVVIRLTPPPRGQGQWTSETLYTFTGSSDGGQPKGALISDVDGNLYGTTYYGGGSCLCGTVFELSPPSSKNNSWTETTLYNFTDGNDGGNPVFGLTFDNDGNLYGTTSYSLTVPCGCGTVFELQRPNGAHSWTEITLHHFSNSDNGGLGLSGVTFDGKNSLYGLSGGTEQTWSHGIAFQVVP